MKNRSALYLTLSGICLILLLAAVNAGELIRLSKTRQSIRYYREALEDVSAIPEQMPQAPGYLPPALPDQMPPPEDPEAEEPGPPAVPAIAEAGAEVRSLLLRHSIRPERLRISGRGTGEAAEFLLRCDPNRFFAFLADTQNKPALRISDISIKPSPDSSLIDITLRIKRGDGFVKKTDPSAQGQNGAAEQSGFTDPRLLARLFYPPRPAEKPAAVKPPDRAELVPPSEPEPPPRPVENQLTFLGIIRDANDTEWLYVKERESGRILSVSADTVSENENRLISAEGDRYVVQIGEKQFITGGTTNETRDRH